MDRRMSMAALAAIAVLLPLNSALAQSLVQARWRQRT